MNSAVSDVSLQATPPLDYEDLPLNHSLFINSLQASLTSLAHLLEHLGHSVEAFLKGLFSVLEFSKYSLTK